VLKQSLFGVALAAIMLAYSSQAREFRHAGAAPTVEQRLLQNLKIPGTDYEIDFSKKQSGGVLPSPALIKAIKYWLSFNFNLRAHFTQERTSGEIRFVHAKTPARRPGFSVRRR